MLKRSIHPGQILRDELKEFGITPTEFARQIDVPPNRVSQIINAKRSITGTRRYALDTGSASTHNSGSTCKRISILSLPIRKRATRSAFCRQRKTCRPKPNSRLRHRVA